MYINVFTFKTFITLFSFIILYIFINNNNTFIYINTYKLIISMNSSNEIPESEYSKTKNENNQSVINGYTVIDTLGCGAFSKVKLVEKEGVQYAMKIIDKKQLQRKKKGFTKNSEGKVIVSSMLDDALREIAILKKINHKNIIKLYEIIQNTEKEKLYLILQICEHGTLMSSDEDTGELLINKNFKNRNNQYKEDEIKDFIRDIVLGLDYLHHNGIIHRDIKPDNILIDKFNNCKITDFNVSAMLENIDKDNIGKKIEGTDNFRAPECCLDSEESKDLKGKPLDIWALGITAFVLAYNTVPFKPQNEWDTLELFDLIAKAEISFPNTRTMSEGFINFIKRCLEKNPDKRITIEEIKQLEWINEKRTNLTELSKPEKISVTNNEVVNCVNFFTTVGRVKKVLKSWKKMAGV